MTEMTSAEFRTGLERLGLSQQAFARLIDVNGRTVQRWATDGDVAAPAARLLRYLVHVGANPASVAKVLDTPIAAATA